MERARAFKWFKRGVVGAGVGAAAATGAGCDLQSGAVVNTPTPKVIQCQIDNDAVIALAQSQDVSESSRWMARIMAAGGIQTMQPDRRSGSYVVVDAPAAPTADPTPTAHPPCVGEGTPVAGTEQAEILTALSNASNYLRNGVNMNRAGFNNPNGVQLTEANSFYQDGKIITPGTETTIAGVLTEVQNSVYLGWVRSAGHEKVYLFGVYAHGKPVILPVQTFKPGDGQLAANPNNPNESHNENDMIIQGEVLDSLDAGFQTGGSGKYVFTKDLDSYFNQGPVSVVNLLFDDRAQQLPSMDDTEFSRAYAGYWDSVVTPDAKNVHRALAALKNGQTSGFITDMSQLMDSTGHALPLSDAKSVVITKFMVGGGSSLSNAPTLPPASAYPKGNY